MVDTFKDKTILITGGTGSFGHSFLDYLIGQEFREVRIFSRDELKQEHMRILLKRPDVKFYIGDIRNRDSVNAAMKGVDYVFHAAALKQVPSCEFFPMEAVMTNIMGSENVINSAIENNVKKVVCLGTDKAVYPINAMGMTKALMEKVAQAAARNSTGNTIVCSVRYGNVMASRGSVIPLFIKQMKNNEPITVTEPSMTRFLLPLSDAIELVVYAFQHAGQGDIFVKKAPACTVGDLVEVLKNMFNSDVPVDVIGMRHGEKIYETLVTREELSRAKDLGDYFGISMDDRGLDYSLFFTEGDTEEVSLEDYTSHSTDRLSIDELNKLLTSLPAIQAELESSGQT